LGFFYGLFLCALRERDYVAFLEVQRLVVQRFVVPLFVVPLLVGLADAISFPISAIASSSVKSVASFQPLGIL
jgi:ABC-type transporter Mla maintaining outer membrane lipid asymmetry permease subunit MlaE